MAYLPACCYARHSPARGGSALGSRIIELRRIVGQCLLIRWDFEKRISSSTSKGWTAMRIMIEFLGLLGGVAGSEPETRGAHFASFTGAAITAQIGPLELASRALMGEAVHTACGKTAVRLSGDLPKTDIVSASQKLFAAECNGVSV